MVTRTKSLGFAFGSSMVVRPTLLESGMVIRSTLLESSKELSGGLKINSFD